jgi:hypothetical protein
MRRDAQAKGKRPTIRLQLSQQIAQAANASLGCHGLFRGWAVYGGGGADAIVDCYNMP